MTSLFLCCDYVKHFAFLYGFVQIANWGRLNLWVEVHWWVFTILSFSYRKPSQHNDDSDSHDTDKTHVRQSYIDYEYLYAYIKKRGTCPVVRWVFKQALVRRSLCCNVSGLPWNTNGHVPDVQYIPRNMHTVFALLCFVVVIHWLIFPYPSGLLHWHCGNLTIAPVPAKQPWWIWINTSCEFIMNDCITTTKQRTTKPCAYFLGYTVVPVPAPIHTGTTSDCFMVSCLTLYVLIFLEGT